MSSPLYPPTHPAPGSGHPGGFPGHQAPGAYPQGYAGPGYVGAPPTHPAAQPGIPGSFAGHPPQGQPGYPVAQPAGPAGPPPARGGPGWWRRNWWALLLILPLVVLTVGPDIPDLLTKWRGFEPTEPVSGTADGWVSYGGGRLRLVSLEPARDVKDHTGRPFTLPSTVQVWQATIEVEADQDAPLNGCRLLLADRRGRTFEANPRELINADLDHDGCLRPYDAPKEGRYTTVSSFLTPTVVAEGVRVTVATELPRYAWLTAPG